MILLLFTSFWMSFASEKLERSRISRVEQQNSFRGAACCSRACPGIRLVRDNHRTTRRSESPDSALRHAKCSRPIYVAALPSLRCPWVIGARLRHDREEFILRVRIAYTVTTYYIIHSCNIRERHKIGAEACAKKQNGAETAPRR
jgi:hypothetical protein